MLEDVIVRPCALVRLRSGPAGSHLDAFVDWLLERDYSTRTICTYVRAAVRLMRWIREVGASVEELSPSMMASYERHLSKRTRRRSRACRRSSYRAGARRFEVFLREQGVLPEPTEPADELSGFRTWLEQHRGLKPNTTQGYLRVAREFRAEVGADASAYQPQCIRDFVLAQAQQHSRAKASQVVSALRNYLRFCIASGECRAGLDDAVPRVANWRLSTLPRYMEPEAVERTIRAVDTATEAGLRDRAVLLLLARLALRAGEVADLRLADLDFDEGRVAVTGKTRQEHWLPLPQDVGEAILEYLTRRATKGGEAVFLTLTVPYRPVASHVVTQIARRAIRRAGVMAPSLGAHVFRHSAATGLLRKGVPVSSIGALLRHESVESVAYYAKVDLQLLSSIARPWPGEGLPC